MTPWLWLVTSYLLGSVPASYLAGRLRGVDLRRAGSGNLGATNTFRVLGAKVAAPVMLFDVLKGFVPTFFFAGWAGLAEPARLGWSLAFGAAAIVGHVFSLYLRFKGGKGVATAAGVFLALAPLAVGVALLVWLTVLRLGRMVSLASIVAALTLLAVLLALPHPAAVRGLGAAIAGFVVFAHRANLGRIRRGEEYRFGAAKPAAREDG